MRRAVLGATLLFAGALLGAARTHHHDEDASSQWKVAGLAFAVPDRWIKEPEAGTSRAAQWRVPNARGETSDPVEVVVFFFGPGVGGSAKENIDAWAGTMTGSDGRPPAPAAATRQVAGHQVTQVMLSGTYAQVSNAPGIPPTPKPAYSLLGAVVENPAGNLYWRVTGPSIEVAALEPIFTRMIDSLKPQDQKP